MKKILTFAAVVAAVAVQAASVNWKADKQAAIKNMNYAVIDPAIILALEGGASPYNGVDAYNEAISAKAAYTAAGLASAIEAQGATNGKGTASGGIDDVGATFTMIFWSGTPADGGKFYYGSFSTDGLTYSGAEVSPGDVAVTSAALTEGTFKAATYIDVPEPTTVALLALGLAAVGLKRKVA